MTKEEQLVAIKDGKNLYVTTDDNIEIDQKSVENKKEEKKEEIVVPVEEQKDNDSEIAKGEPEVTTTASETSSEFEPDVKLNSEIPSIDVSPAPIATETNKDATLAPEPIAPETTFTIPVADVDFNNNYPTTSSEASVPAYEQAVQNNDFSTPTYETSSFNDSQATSENTFSDLANGVELEKVADVVSSVEDVRNLEKATKIAFDKILEEVYKKIKKPMELLEEAEDIFVTAEEKATNKHWYDMVSAWRLKLRGLREKSKEEVYESSKIIPFTQGYSDNGYQDNNDIGSNGNSFVA